MSEHQGIEVRAIREALGDTQAQFARRLGVTPESVSRWERGLSEPKSELLRQAIVALAETGSTRSSNLIPCLLDQAQSKGSASGRSKYDSGIPSTHVSTPKGSHTAMLIKTGAKTLGTSEEAVVSFLVLALSTWASSGVGLQEAAEQILDYWSLGMSECPHYRPQTSPATDRETGREAKEVEYSGNE
mgnify:CR=1 FL=1